MFVHGGHLFNASAASTLCENWTVLRIRSITFDSSWVRDVSLDVLCKGLSANHYGMCKSFQCAASFTCLAESFVHVHVGTGMIVSWACMRARDFEERKAREVKEEEEGHE